MNAVLDASGYQYTSATREHAHAYLMPTVMKDLVRLSGSRMASEPHLFDLGYGNGSMAAELHQAGWKVVGVDSSDEGIAQAKRAHPDLRLQKGSAYEDLAARYGRFTVVISLEVVKHVYAPRHYARSLFDLVEPGGTAIVSTPYHGYWKNLALALTGKLDQHFTALWDHGHIKFWSIPTLSRLLGEAGFVDIRFHRVGRIPQLAKSMIAVVKKPDTPDAR